MPGTRDNVDVPGARDNVDVPGARDNVETGERVLTGWSSALALVSVRMLDGPRVESVLV